MPRKKSPPPIVATLDFETDPFEYGNTIAPFCAGLYFRRNDGSPVYVDFWGPDCVARVLDCIAVQPERMIIYVHNGGKFDFRFMVPHLENPLIIIKGRIVKARFGIHEFRDSFAIIPLALKNANAKETIDYADFIPEKREAKRAEILAYLKSDCVYLYELCYAFVCRFGPRLTIGGTAARELRKLHPQINGNQSHDESFRRFYFGGRVQCFELGEIRGRFKIFDVNSMYPAAMRGFQHPKGRQYIRPAILRLDRNGWLERFPERMYFVRVRCKNNGALPVRIPGVFGGLSFEVKEGEFCTTSHELRAAMELRRVWDVEILEAFVPRETQDFAAYVDLYAEEKATAKRSGDKIAETFAKLLLNSAYGRFAINPFEFYDYVLVKPEDARPGDGYQPYAVEDGHDFELWRKRTNEPGQPDPVRGFEDVAIAASITGAARSILLRAIHNAKRPIYCDTDSLICEDLRGVEIDPVKLGAWKPEGSPDYLAIAGKKLYAAFEGGECIKLASKGVKVTADELVKVARGESHTYKRDAPTFTLLGSQSFIDREIVSEKVRQSRNTIKKKNAALLTAPRQGV